MDRESETERSLYMSPEQILITLQAQIKEQEEILDEFRSSTASIKIEPSHDQKIHHEQLCCLAAAYLSFTETSPFLPTPDSLLLDLLALRVTSRTIKETQSTITQCKISLHDIERRIEKEKADFEDSKLLHDEILTRISSLQEESESRSQKSQEILALEEIQELERKKKYYESQTSGLMLDLDSFIDEHLAPMLAVEELGGPIVGQLLDLDGDTLQSSFTSRGRLKKIRLKEDKRQRRISQIWGARPMEEEEWDERKAAASEIKELTEKLLNSVEYTDDNNPNSYIKLHRESAAARFLVRSKVAQYHPKDASRIRLIEFGDEIGN